MAYKREDFVVLDEKNLRDYQMQILDITKDIVKFMDSHKLEYSLSGGSILGAVRHQGFIPWDDDIDLNIPREDYNRMIELFDSELGDKYYLQTPEKYPDLGLMVTQIRKKGTIARRKYDWNIDECGISIDVYILENVFNDYFRRFIQKNLSMILSFSISAVRFYNNRVIPREIQEMEGRQFNYSKSKMLVGKILKNIPLRKWISWCDYWNSICKDSFSKLVAIPTGRKHFNGEIYERQDMCVYKKTLFEGEMFNIPVSAEKYLADFYGNYMELPPIEKREKHLFLELKY